MPSLSVTVKSYIRSPTDRRFPIKSPSGRDGLTVVVVVVVVVVVTVVAVVVVVVVVVAAAVMEGACVAVVVVVVTPAVAEVTDNCDTVEETAWVAEILAAVVVYVTAVSNVDRVVCSVVVATTTVSVVWVEDTPVLCDTADDDSEKVSSPQAHRLISIPTDSTNTNTRFIRILLILHIDTPIVALIFKKVKTKFSDLFTITSHCYTTNRV